MENERKCGTEDRRKCSSDCRREVDAAGAGGVEGSVAGAGRRVLQVLLNRLCPPRGQVAATVAGRDRWNSRDGDTERGGRRAEGQWEVVVLGTSREFNASTRTSTAHDTPEVLHVAQRPASDARRSIQAVHALPAVAEVLPQGRQGSCRWGQAQPAPSSRTQTQTHFPTGGSQSLAWHSSQLQRSIATWPAIHTRVLLDNEFGFIVHITFSNTRYYAQKAKAANCTHASKCTPLAPVRVQPLLTPPSRPTDLSMP